MNLHKKCLKKSAKLKHSTTNTNNNHSKPPSLQRKELINLDQNSLISLCSPFIIPQDTKHHTYLIQRDEFNKFNSKISLSVIYGEINEPPNLASSSLHYSHINKNKHLNNLLSSILLLDEIDNNKLYYNAINNSNDYLIPDIESDLDDIDTDIDTLLTDDSISISISNDLHLPNNVIAGSTTLLHDCTYEKTVLDIDNDFNTDFANILSEIDVHIAST